MATQSGPARPIDGTYAADRDRRTAGTRSLNAASDWASRLLRQSQALREQQAWTRYGLAVAFGLIAVALKSVVETNLGAATGFLSFVGAVILASWLCGLGGGLIATAISAVAQVTVFEAPSGLLFSAAEFVRITWFVADGILVAAVTSGLNRASITEQHARREATRLVDVVSRFKSTVDASPDAVLMFDPNSLLVAYANQSAAALLGVGADMWIGRSVTELQPRLGGAEFQQKLLSFSHGTADVMRFAGAAPRSDGRSVPYEAVVQKVHAGDGSKVMVLSARDMTERIEVQARLARVAGDERRQAAELRTVLEAMGEGVLVIDSTSHVRLANGAAAEMFGEVPTTFAEISLRLGLDTADVPALGQTSEPHIAQNADGRWFEIAAHLVESGAAGADGETSTIVSLRDVTRAHHAQQAREAFIGVLSHELRTPVTTIYGYAKVFRRPKRAANQAEMLSDIEREADRLYRIVEDLLALSRVEGGLTIDAEPLLLQHLVNPLLASESHRWPKSHFEASFPPDLPAVFGDRTYVEQVMRNLLTNAAKYSPADTTVTVNASASPTEVIVSVLDRGAGIADEEAERLFQLYYRSPRTARAATGAGIGLFVGRSLVTAMGGRMWAVPREGGGSIFSFSLRRCEEDSAAAGDASD